MRDLGPFDVNLRQYPEKWANSRLLSAGLERGRYKEDRGPIPRFQVEEPMAKISEFRKMFK